MVALLLDGGELVADLVEGLVEGGKRIGALGAGACRLEVLVLGEGGSERGRRGGGGRGRTLYMAEDMGGGGA